jgi:hypothetical protein
MLKILFSILLVYSPAIALADSHPPQGQTLTATLQPFQTDGCTGFVDGPPGRPTLWLHCCTEHDLRYWFGGSQEDIQFADLALRSCVNDVAGSGWSRLIYDAVVAGHSSPVKSKTRWSWGWDPQREDLALTPDELVYVKSELHKLPMESSAVEAFIQKYLPGN